jgi:glutamyl-tRNA synthetase
MSSVRTRFAPSPTGDLHLGGAWAALGSWAWARAARGTFVVRVEDIDSPRVVPGAEGRIRDDLAWLGLEADEGPDHVVPGQLAATNTPVTCASSPYRQSLRGAFYEEALAELSRQNRIYPCDCSRGDIALVASAPHAGEELVYPGTCSEKDPKRGLKREPALRFRILPEDEILVSDLVQGELDPRLLQQAGDFVLRRGDAVFAYHLAVAVDDLAMRISHVVRGVDLLASTPRQLLLMGVLSTGALAWAPKGGALPRYAHVPMVVGPDGARLAKRTRGATVREIRERGVPPEILLGQLAHGLGLVQTAGPVAAEDLARRLRGQEIRFRNKPWPIP